MKYLTVALCVMISFHINAQVPEDSELFKTLKANDSLLFDIGFNTCDMEQSGKLLADDLEFYHDQGGITSSKAEFMEVMKNGICKSDDFISRRELIPGSLQVYPLYDNGKLYGALQKGVHRFFEKPKGKPERNGSVAKFTHLWLLQEDGSWLIKRVLSYDHN